MERATKNAEKAARNRARFRAVARKVLKNSAGQGAIHADNPRAAYRSVFVSDCHLGSKRSQAEKLAGFLSSHKMEHLYLVGDIVDGWRFTKFGHWPDSHTGVLSAIFAKVREGTDVVFTPGNHDHMFRAYMGRDLKGIAVHHDVVHEAADGRRYWVIHGDGFDGTAYVPAWMFHIADLANRALHGVNEGYNLVRKRLGLSRKCLVHYLKNTSKHGETFKRKFAQLVATATKDQGTDGVICGHIHKPESRTIAGINYINLGDWVDHATALVEHFDGRMELVRWNPRPSHQN